MNARKQKLCEIFDKLDQDRDGEISSNNIDLRCLGPSLLVAFRPLLDELEALHQPLDKDEFVDAGLRLYGTLPQSEKNLILNFDKSKKKITSERDNCTFAPQTNKNYLVKNRIGSSHGSKRPPKYDKYSFLRGNTGLNSQMSNLTLD